MNKVCMKCGDFKNLNAFLSDNPVCRDCTHGYCFYIYKGLAKCSNCNTFRDRHDFKKLIRGKPALGEHCQYCQAQKSIEDQKDIITTSECSGCFEIKDSSKFHSYIDNRDNKVRLRSRCTDCERGSCKIQYKDYLYCKDCKSIKLRIEFNPGVQNNKYKSTCSECSRKYAQIIRDNTPPEIKREHGLKYRKKYKEREKKRLRKWQKENKDKMTVIYQRRRTRKKNLENTLTIEQWETVLGSFGGTCALCDSTEIPEMDHWIPISWEEIGNVVGNVVPLCQTHNVSKSAKNPNDWIVYAQNVDANKVIKLYKHLAEINELTVEEYKELVNLCYKNRKKRTYTKKNNPL